MSFKTQITQSYKSSLHHLESSSRALLGIPPPGARAFDMELRLGKNEGGKAWPLWAHGWKSFKFFPGGFPKLHDFVWPPIRTNQRGDLVKVGLEWLSHWFMAVRDPKKGFFPQRLEIVQETGSKTSPTFWTIAPMNIMPDFYLFRNHSSHFSDEYIGISNRPTDQPTWWRPQFTLLTAFQTFYRGLSHAAIT